MNSGGIFLDRDGTINEEVSFLSTPDELKLIDGSAEAIREANQLGFKVFIVTNQSGIARGILTEEQLANIHRTLLNKLGQYQAHIDAIYYCPHHANEGNSPLTTACTCRKPNTGMIQQAMREFTVDPKRSFVIGDRLIDMQLALNAGMTGIMVLTGYGKDELELCKEHHIHIDHVAPDLYNAVLFIKHTIRKEQLPIAQR